MISVIKIPPPHYRTNASENYDAAVDNKAYFDVFTTGSYITSPFVNRTIC